MAYDMDRENKKENKKENRKEQAGKAPSYTVVFHYGSGELGDCMAEAVEQILNPQKGNRKAG